MNLVENFSVDNIAGIILSFCIFTPKIISNLKTRRANNKKGVLYLLEVVLMCVITFLMVVPVGTPRLKFGYVSGMGVAYIWFLSYSMLLFIYLLSWHLSDKDEKDSRVRVIIPAIIFIVRGLLLRQWILCIFGAIFAMVDYYITIALPKRQTKQI